MGELVMDYKCPVEVSEPLIMDLGFLETLTEQEQLPKHRPSARNVFKS